MQLVHALYAYYEKDELSTHLALYIALCPNPAELCEENAVNDIDYANDMPDYQWYTREKNKDSYPIKLAKFVDEQLVTPPVTPIQNPLSVIYEIYNTAQRQRDENFVDEVPSSGLLEEFVMFLHTKNQGSYARDLLEDLTPREFRINFNMFVYDRLSKDIIITQGPEG